jgi:very-short-patch-repair endonuclease
MQHKERPLDICYRLAELRHGVFTRTEALEAGMSRRQIDGHIATGLFVPLYRGVYSFRGTSKTFEQRVMAAVSYGGSGSAAAFSTAARLHKLDGYRDEAVEVISPRHLKEVDFISRRNQLDREDITVVSAIPSTNIHRTLVDLGAVSGEEKVEVAMYCALCRRQTSIARLRKQLAWTGGRGRPGSAMLRRLLDIAEGLPFLQSALEVKFERLIRPGELPRPIRQFPVSIAERNYYIDFAYPHASLAIECDGYKWHADPKAVTKDKRKHNDLVDLGWRVYYLTWEMCTRKPNQVLDEIGRILVPRLG